MSKSSIRPQKIILATSVLLLLVKFVAYFLTNSNAILTDALDSIGNIAAASLGLYSLLIASKPKDSNHPYGHGKIEFISTAMEGSMISIAGIIIIAKSAFNLFYPNTIHQLQSGILLIAFCGLLNFIIGWIMEKKGKKFQSLILIAGGKHLQTDAWSTAGLIIGLLLIFFTGYIWLDSAVAILFGAIILYAGFRILRKSIAGIMDEADIELLSAIIKQLNDNRQHNWVDIHNLRIIKYGANLHFDCHLTIPYYFTINEGHAEMEKLETLLQLTYESSKEWFVHADPCVPPAMCKICIKEDCGVRQAAFEKRIEWNLQNVLSNRKHGFDRI